MYNNFIELSLKEMMLTDGGAPTAAEVGEFVVEVICRILMFIFF